MAGRMTMNSSRVGYFKHAGNWGSTYEITKGGMATKVRRFYAGFRGLNY